jgi:uncharacterized protein YgiM (DUF1202 family)
MKTNVPFAWLFCFASTVSSLQLAGEEIAVVKDGRINVRGQPSLVGEVITQLQKGEKVVVLEEINVAKPKTNEPPRWARIQMPSNTPVWVFASYIDPTGKNVKVNRLNLRAGPGENYSVVGRLQKGTPVTEIRRVENWMEIETPPGAYAFVAADLLTKSTESSVATQTPTAPPPIPPPPVREPTKTEPPPVAAPAQSAPTEITVANVPPPLPQPTQAPKPAPATTEIRVANRNPEPAPPPPTAAAAQLTAVTLAKPKQDLQIPRVVRREGIVHGTLSIQAPSYYELLSPQNHKTINFLHTEKPDLKLKDYRGRRIIVTGEEAIDPRWPNTPLIEVQTLELIP